MRWLFALAATIALLAACEESGEGTEAIDTVENIETVEEPQILQPDGEVPVIGESRTELLRAQCTAQNGRFSAVGAGHICFSDTPDGGKACNTSTDCTTDCLARTRTCAPVTPLLGCHEIFTATGSVMTQCRDF